MCSILARWQLEPPMEFFAKMFPQERGYRWRPCPALVPEASATRLNCIRSCVARAPHERRRSRDDRTRAIARSCFLFGNCTAEPAEEATGEEEVAAAAEEDPAAEEEPPPPHPLEGCGPLTFFFSLTPPLLSISLSPPLFLLPRLRRVSPQALVLIPLHPWPLHTHGRAWPATHGTPP